MVRDGGIVTGWRIRATLVGLGTVLLGVTLFEMYLWWVVRSFVEISFVAGVLMSVPAASLLVAGGYLLPRTAASDHHRHLLAWTFAGLVVFGGFSAITGVTFFPESSWAKVGSLRWGASVGAGGGFLVGFLFARGVERRVAVERAAVRTEEAKENQQTLEYLNAVLRHETLNTANVIGGHAGLITSELDDDSPMREYTELIKRQTEEFSTILDDVQLLLRASGGGPDLELEPVDLRSVLETELQNLHDRYPGVETELDAPPEVHVMADPLVRRTFSNLLQNAVKHNDSARKRVSVSVTRAVETVTIDVADNGPGIPDDERDGLFDPSIKETNNHGLGLIIVTRMADRYGGDVELVGTGPDGTVFSVTLPSASSGSEGRSKEPEGTMPAPR